MNVGQDTAAAQAHSLQYSLQAIVQIFNFMKFVKFVRNLLAKSCGAVGKN